MIDSLPTYSGLVTTIAVVVFGICYALAVIILIVNSRATKKQFSLSSIVVALVIAFSGSLLSLLALFVIFGNA